MEPFIRNQFIIEYFIEDETLCDDLIGLHKSTPKKEINKQCSCCNAPIKTSSDVAFDLKFLHALPEPVQRLQGELLKATGLYSQTYPEANWVQTRVSPGVFNIQHYRPGDGFYSWHHELSAYSLEARARAGVWMLYLNDVPDGGTEFKFQERTVQAEKGKMVLWPSYFTHEHRGVISTTTEKYIATGWFNDTV